MLCFCGPDQQIIDNIMDDGVDVVLNHKEPYTVQIEKGSFKTERLFSIDMEAEKNLDINLVNIESFDVEDEANNYLIIP